MGVLSWIIFPTYCFLISLFSLVFLSLVRFWSPLSDPLSHFYSLLIVDPSWWWNILDICESLHSWDLSGSLGPSYYFNVSNHVLRVGLMTVLLKWFSSNLWLTLNLVFCWQTLPRHYLLSSETIGISLSTPAKIAPLPFSNSTFTWSVLIRFGPILTSNVLGLGLVWAGLLPSYKTQPPNCSSCCFEGVTVHFRWIGIFMP